MQTTILLSSSICPVITSVSRKKGVLCQFFSQACNLENILTVALSSSLIQLLQIAFDNLEKKEVQNSRKNSSCRRLSFILRKMRPEVAKAAAQSCVH